MVDGLEVCRPVEVVAVEMVQFGGVLGEAAVQACSWDGAAAAVQTGQTQGKQAQLG